jgi:hypothetical protein
VVYYGHFGGAGAAPDPPWEWGNRPLCPRGSAGCIVGWGAAQSLRVESFSHWRTRALSRVRHMRARTCPAEASASSQLPRSQRNKLTSAPSRQLSPRVWSIGVDHYKGWLVWLGWPFASVTV